MTFSCVVFFMIMRSYLLHCAAFLLSCLVILATYCYGATRITKAVGVLGENPPEAVVEKLKLIKTAALRIAAWLVFYVALQIGSLTGLSLWVSGTLKHSLRVMGTITAINVACIFAVTQALIAVVLFIRGSIHGSVQRGHRGSRAASGDAVAGVVGGGGDRKGVQRSQELGVVAEGRGAAGSYVPGSETGKSVPSTAAATN